MIKFLFEEVGVNRIEATHPLENPNSGKVMAKCGLKYEGTLRQAGKNNQGLFDELCFAVLAEDYFGNKKNNLTIGDITIDCSDDTRVREFYANLTGWERIVAYNCLALKAYNGLTILFVKTDIPYTPPVWPEEPGKQQKQMHFNFQVDDLAAAVNEAIKLGATKAATQYDGDYCS